MVWQVPLNADELMDLTAYVRVGSNVVPRKEEQEIRLEAFGLVTGARAMSMELLES